MSKTTDYKVQWTPELRLAVDNRIIEYLLQGYSQQEAEEKALLDLLDHTTFNYPEVTVTAQAPVLKQVVTESDWDPGYTKFMSGERYYADQDHKNYLDWLRNDYTRGIREATDKWGKGIGLGMMTLAAMPVASGAASGISTGLNAFKTAYPAIYSGIKTGLNLGFTIDGVRNALSDNGVQKTYRIGKDIYQNGLTGLKAWDFTKSAAGDVLDIAGGAGLAKDVFKGGKNLHKLITTGTSNSNTLNSLRDRGRKLLDDRFNTVIFPEHMRGIEWYNKEIAPGRVGRSFDDVEKSKLFYENVDRFHLTGPDRMPLSKFFTWSGVASPDGRVLYNPFIRKNTITPTAVHEGHHRVLFLDPAFHDVQTVKTVNPKTGSVEVARVDPGSFRKAPLYHYDTGKVIPEANFDPMTGESLHLDFDVKRDLSVGTDRYGDIRIQTPEGVTLDGKNYFLKNNGKDYNGYYHSSDLRGLIDAPRLEAQSKALPIREYGNVTVGSPASTLALEKDASTVEMLYNLSKKHNGITGDGLTFIILNSPDKEIQQLLKKTNGYTLNYLANMLLNHVLGLTKPHEDYDLIRKALLMRKNGGKLNYLNYFN